MFRVFRVISLRNKKKYVYSISLETEVQEEIYVTTCHFLKDRAKLRINLERKMKV